MFYPNVIQTHKDVHMTTLSSPIYYKQIIKFVGILLLSTLIVLSAIYLFKIKDSFIALSAQEKTEFKNTVLQNKVVLFKCAPMFIFKERPTVSDIELKIASMYLSNETLTVQDSNNFNVMLDKCHMYNAEKYKQKEKIIQLYNKGTSEIIKNMTKSEYVH